MALAIEILIMCAIKRRNPDAIFAFCESDVATQDLASGVRDGLAQLKLVAGARNHRDLTLSVET